MYYHTVLHLIPVIHTLNRGIKCTTISVAYYFQKVSFFILNKVGIYVSVFNLRIVFYSFVSLTWLEENGEV